jgi:hypothetical protein
VWTIEKPTRRRPTWFAELRRPYNRDSMTVLLVLDRGKSTPGIWAMVLTAIDDDPRLLESKLFQGETALKVWLAGIGARYGRENIQVNWTELLRTDDRLAEALRDSVGAVAPEA